LTLRELFQMADARMTLEKAAWHRMAVMAVALYEPHRDTKKRRRPFTTADFNPYEPAARPSGIRLGKQTIAVLKPLFVE